MAALKVGGDDARPSGVACTAWIGRDAIVPVVLAEALGADPHEQHAEVNHERDSSANVASEEPPRRAIGDDASGRTGEVRDGRAQVGERTWT